MAAARKPPRRTVLAKISAKSKGAKRRPVKATLPPTTRAPSLALPVIPPGFLIVGIGASAGGLEAMEEFFRHTSPRSGMAFVVVSHQHAGHVSLLPSLLSKCTAMPVMEAADGMEVEANRVYMAPGGTNLAILHGTLHIIEPASQDRVPLPIDYFFRSLAEDQKQRAVGIILSGTGTDGTLGLRAIKAESGMAIAQDPQSALARAGRPAPYGLGQPVLLPDLSGDAARGRAATPLPPLQRGMEHSRLTFPAGRDFTEEHLIPGLHRGQDVSPHRSHDAGAQWPST